MSEATEPVKVGKNWVVKFTTEMGSVMTFTCNNRDAALAIIKTMAEPTRASSSEVPEFKPCVIHYEEGNFSQMLLEDCATVTGWPEVIVEPLYRMKGECKEIVGFQWHGKTPPPVRASSSRAETGEPSLAELLDGQQRMAELPMSSLSSSQGELAEAVERWRKARLATVQVGLQHPDYMVLLNELSEAENALANMKEG
jgi:hypothetical protein